MGIIKLIFIILVFYFIFLLLYPVFSSAYQDNYNKAFFLDKFLSDKNTGAYYPINDSIVIRADNEKTYDKILKHELCHRNQHYENRTKYTFWGRFINELECYLELK